MAARTWGGILVVLLTMGALTAVGATGSFVDDDDSVHQADIEAIAAAGITKGCNPPANDRFCPDEPVTRAQMASFLVRADVAENVSFTVTVDGVTYLIPGAACLATPADEALLRQIVAESGEATRQLALQKWTGYPTTTTRPGLDTEIRDSAVRSLALGTIAGIDDVVVAWWRAWEPYFFGPGEHPFTEDEPEWRDRSVDLVAAIETACG